MCHKIGHFADIFTATLRDWLGRTSPKLPMTFPDNLLANTEETKPNVTKASNMRIKISKLLQKTNKMLNTYTTRKPS